MRCMISQPTFIPWLGWFDLADQSDHIVLLDTVQFDKRSWQQRNYIRTSRGLDLITVPVRSSGRYDQHISEVKISDTMFGNRFLRTIRANYSRAPFFAPVMKDLEFIVPKLVKSERLVELNKGLIALLAEWLGIKMKMISSSTLNINGKRGEQLALICDAINCSEYLSTVGAEDYLVEDISHFSSRRISILLYEYSHPEYAQLHTPFIKYASALDLIMMEGKNSGNIMRSTRKQLRRLTDKESL